MSKITDAYLKSLKGTEKERLISVGEGLYLRITRNRGGGTAKKWLLRYTDTTGHGQKFVLGVYPDLSLAKARSLAEDMKAKARQGINLAREKALEKKSLAEQREQPKTTFKSVAEEWLQRQTNHQWGHLHAIRQRQRLEGNIFPVFGNKDINLVEIKDIDQAISIIINRGALETATRVLTILEGILRYADTVGKLQNPAIILRLNSYKREMPKPKAERHLYQEMTEGEISLLLYRLHASRPRWTLQTGVAICMIPYLLCRPGELCGARWEEFDLESKEWKIPAERMKMRRDHIVPLSRQALALLKEIRFFSGTGEYVFPSRKNGHITIESLLRILRRLGYGSSNGKRPFTTHGFRGMASTLLHQTLQYPSHLIEHQLAHVEQNKVKAAYNRITARSFLEERREMMQTYANFLDTLMEKGHKKMCESIM